MNTTYFLGSNTPFGFIGKYDHLLKEKCYVLLGCPGSGKSTILKKVLNVATECGYDTETYLCSSDVKSLDAVYIKSLNVSVIDGTSPHAIAANMPTRQFVVNLLENAYFDKIYENNAEIERCIDTKKIYFKSAYCDLQCLYLQKTQNKPKKQLNFSKTIDDIFEIIKNERGENAVRYVSAVTNKGIIDNILGISAKNIAIHTDELTILDIIDGLISKLNANNMSFTSFYNPIFNKPDAILIGDYLILGANRTKNYDNYFDISEDIPSSDIENTLLSRALTNLENARNTHISLEKYLNPAMNWDDIGKKTDKLLLNIFKNA